MHRVATVNDLMSIKIDIKGSDTVRVLDLVLSQFDNVTIFLKRENPTSSNVADGMCLMASRFFNGILKENGFQPKVLQGEIEISKNDWLEHHVSILYLIQHWIVVDFCISQFIQYEGFTFLVLICDPNQTSLKAALKNAYNWWIPGD